MWSMAPEHNLNGWGGFSDHVQTWVDCGEEQGGESDHWNIDVASFSFGLEGQDIKSGHINKHQTIGNVFDVLDADGDIHATPSLFEDPISYYQEPACNNFGLFLWKLFTERLLELHAEDDNNGLVDNNLESDEVCHAVVAPNFEHASHYFAKEGASPPLGGSASSEIQVPTAADRACEALSVLC